MNTLIFGATDVAQLAHHTLTQELGEDVAAFVVDEAYRTHDTLLGLPVLGWDAALNQYPAATHRMFLAVGYRTMRQRGDLFARVKASGYGSMNIISPHSNVANGVKLGTNNFIMAGVVIEPFAVLGDNNIVWSNATICHHAQVGDHNFIAARVVLGGHAKLGSLNFVGVGAMLEQCAQVGRETLVGAHALVRGTTRDLQHYWGTPARAQRPVDPTAGITLSDDAN